MATAPGNKVSLEKNARKPRSLTDKEYEELFDGILRQSLLSEAMENDQVRSQSQKEYATLQPVIGDDELRAPHDFEVDFGSTSPATKQQVGSGKSKGTAGVASQNKLVKQPIWKSNKTISDVKSSKINRETKKAKSTGKKACYSMDTSIAGKAREKNLLSSGINSRKAELGAEKGKDCDEDFEKERWSLTQECTKGVWIQCGEPDCGKWRHLAYMHDPSQFINIKWKCSDSEDSSRNTCDAPMESWDQHASWTYNRYTEGSIVWAKLDGYPWWPGMIEVDPDMQAFVFCFEHSYYTPAEYHVTFFDTERVTRAWVCKQSIKPFIASRIWEQTNAKSNSKRLQDAVAQAEESLNLSLVQRLRNHGFTTRYEGRIVGSTAPCLQNSSLTQSSSTTQKDHASATSKSLKKTKAKQNRSSPVTTKLNEDAFPQKSTKHQEKDRSTRKKKESTGSKPTSSTPVDRNENADKGNINSVTENVKESSQQSKDGTSKTSFLAAKSSQRPVVPSTDSQTTSRDSQQFMDMEKELDEIESILSQSLMSQRSLSLSPAPQRSKPLGLTNSINRCVSPSSNNNGNISQNSNRSKSTSPIRDSGKMASPAAGLSQSGSEADRHLQKPDNVSASKSKCVDVSSKSQPGKDKSKPKISKSELNRPVTPTSGATAAKKLTKKGFKCPTRTVNPTKDEEVSSKSVVSVGGLNVANNSVFTQELSGASISQKSPASQPLRLSNNSLFTQELSGKDPFTRASNIEPKCQHSSQDVDALDKANIAFSSADRSTPSQEQPESPNSSSIAQNFSGKNPFTPASCVNRGCDIQLDNSVFTQELSNKVKTQKRRKKGSRVAKKVMKMDEDDYGSYSESSSDSDENAGSTNTRKLSDNITVDIARES